MNGGKYLIEIIFNFFNTSDYFKAISKILIDFIKLSIGNINFKIYS